MRSLERSLTDCEERALALDGLSQVHGSMVWPSIHPPLLVERATLVSSRIPEWAVARSITAGWVWTGIGRAEPWSVYAPKTPAISPLARQEWRPRVVELEKLELRQLGALRLLSPVATARDLLEAAVSDEVASTQLFLLTTPDTVGELIESLPEASRSTPRVRRRLGLVASWWQAHPVVTR